MKPGDRIVQCGGLSTVDRRIVHVHPDGLAQMDTAWRSKTTGKVLRQVSEIIQPAEWENLKAELTPTTGLFVPAGGRP